MKDSRSIADAAEEVLLNVGEPLHIQTITSMILGKCNLTGKTPHRSVAACLATNTKFKRVAEGTYALNSWKEYPTARFAKDIAYDVLKKRGKPISLFSLGEKILAERKFIGGPAMVARGVVNSDDRFSLDKRSEMVTLAEWENNK